ncbi:thioether cross-link-forming SCIFF peptide maturase [Desulfovirgula thermocuniculi]|uniref:thioether cross-link-forming SCIFF peptide maturase n=1 Tax=Desulfovirgula thermocuniculi TaxID=348842 RepID=UPI0004179D84|nr:thioether cross-link-forming SCIFF peptide maturase [Desulfovirgula thermocuniculi]
MLHRFTINGYHLVLDANSGALHLVDGLVYDLLGEYPPADRRELVARFSRFYPREQVEEALAELEQLEGEGLLFSPDPLEDACRVPQERGLKALCLNVAHDCNLACRYCFAGQGNFGGEAGLMPLEVGQKAIDFLLTASGPRRRVEVDFFGGEPLLNLPVLKELVAYGREKAEALGKHIKFTVTTNALLLNPDVAAYLNEQDMAVVLSIDGRPQVHDAMRVFPGGGGSYRYVLENVKRFVATRPQGEYYIRGTFTRHNLDFARDVLHLADLGFKKISLEPVVACGAADYALRPEDVPAVCAEYEELARLLVERSRAGEPFEFFHFNIDLEGGPCLVRRLWGCGAGVEYLAVTPGGDLYPCHQFVGRPEFCLGHVAEGITRRDLVEQFKAAHVYNKEPCRQCWARFFCGGGCHANAHAYAGSIMQPPEIFCALVKKRIECALYVRAALSGVPDNA